MFTVTCVGCLARRNRRPTAGQTVAHCGVCKLMSRLRDSTTSKNSELKHYDPACHVLRDYYIQGLKYPLGEWYLSATSTSRSLQEGLDSKLISINVHKYIRHVQSTRPAISL
jgi:hypothetical protein